MSDVMIEARHLTKRYGPARALDDATFEVRKGEVVGFLGPNGAGKSTTMKILTCFIAPSEGLAKVNGCDIWEDPIGARASIGYLPESTPLYTEMLVLEYLQFMAQMRGLRGEAARKRIKRVVEQTSLGDVIAKEIRQLSKGYRQRVGLAQALVHEPPILILDEPMSGLDPNQAREIRDLIRELGKDRTVILSTHNLAEVQVTCQRVLIISKGRLVADDTPEALTRRGTRRYTVTVKANGKSLDAVREVFSKIAGVDSVRESGSKAGETTLEIAASSEADLRAEIFAAAVAGGVVLLELRGLGQNLEQIFRDLTLTPIAADEDDEDEDDDDDDDEDEDEDEKASDDDDEDDDEDEDEDEDEDDDDEEEDEKGGE